MAKKKEQLTFNEILAKSCIPIAEQPFEIPEDWKWCRLGDIYEINPKNMAQDDTLASFVPMDKASAGMDYGFDYDVMPWGKAKKGHVQLANGDVSFAKITPCFENRKSMIIQNLKNGIGAGSTEFVVLRQSAMNQFFTYYLITDERFIRGGLGTYSGTVGQQRISMDFVRNYPVPVPPRTVQNKLVDLIEREFQRIRKAEELIHAALDSAEERKQSILHKAFTGELTEKWRLENGISNSTWHTEKLKKICDVNPKKEDVNNLPDDTKVSFFPMASLDEITGTITSPQVRSLGEVKKGFTNFREGDVVFAKITPCMENGKSAVIGKLVNDIGYGTTEFYVLRCTDKINNRFLFHLIRSKRFRKAAKQEMTGAVGQQRVPKKYLEEYEIFLPGIDEQDEIVKLLDSFINEEDTFAEIANQTMLELEELKKSILNKAFRGDLIH